MQIRVKQRLMSSLWKDVIVELTGSALSFKDSTSSELLCRIPAECIRSLAMDNNPSNIVKKERELIITFNPSSSSLMFISKNIAVTEPTGPLTSTSVMYIYLSIVPKPGVLSGWLPLFVPFFNAIKQLNEEIDINLTSSSGDIPFRSSHTDFGMTSIGLLI